MNSDLEQQSMDGSKGGGTMSDLIPDEYKNNSLDMQFECKAELESEDEDGQERMQRLIDYVRIDVKEEIGDPKGTTEDESMAVEALRQLGSTFESTSSSIQVLSPVRQHICSICGDSFERKTDLGNHLVCHQVDRPHACRICGNLFTRKADLQNHMVCHQVDRPHRCTQCGADFQRPSSLTNHMKIHTYFPGRALGVTAIQNHQNLPTSTLLQADQNRVSIVQVQPVNGWNDNYTSIGNSAAESSIIPQNEQLESSVTSKSQNLNYQSTQYTNGNSSQSSYQENPGPYIESIQTLQQDQRSNRLDSDQQEIENQPGCSVNRLDNVNQMEEITKNSNTNYNSDINIDTVEEVQTELSATSTTENQPTNKPRSRSTDNQSKVLVDTSLRPHICRHCGIGFARSKALISHERLHQDHWGYSMECGKCEEIFTDEVALVQHQQLCNGKRRQGNQNQTEIPKNNQSHSTVTANMAAKYKQYARYWKHHCSECDKRFTTKQKLYRHMWIHRKRPYICEVCGISLTDRSLLDEHRRNEHPGDTPFTCAECGKSFASRQGLWEHGRLHGTGIQETYPFICQRCGKRFASRQGHLIHTRTHTGERPYGCRYCWKAFRDGGTLRKHERIHTGERPHVCPLCPRAFNQKVVLREHVRWVHAARNSEGCPLCGYVIGDREALCAHIVKHSDHLAAAAKASKEKKSSLNDYNKKAGNLENITHITNIINAVATAESSVTTPIVSSSVLPLESFQESPNYGFPSNSEIIDTPNSEIIDTPSSEIIDTPNSETINTPSNTFVNNKICEPEIKCEFYCDMCGEGFQDRTKLLAHVQIHI